MEIRTNEMRKIELEKDYSKKDKGLILKASEDVGFDKDKEIDTSLLTR